MAIASASERLPVIVGVGQSARRPEHADGVSDPCWLVETALRRAAKDTGVGDRLLRRVQSLRVPRILSWAYGDAAASVGERLGLAPAETVGTSIGGDSPQLLLNDAAESIARGELDVAAIAGAEALHTLALARR